MEKPTVVICGAGDHACVLIEVIEHFGLGEVYGLLDPVRKAPVGRFRVLGGDEMLKTLPEQVTHFAVGIGSVGSSSARKKVFDQAVDAGLLPLTVIHPSAAVSPSARIEAGAQVLAGAVVGPLAEIGFNAVINSGAIVEHHSRVAAHAHVASGACLTGRVTVGEESFIGARAVVRQGVSIGAQCTVGMGSVVLRDLVSGTTVYGVPARPVSR